jgi:hypothetical protein
MARELEMIDQVRVLLEWQLALRRDETAHLRCVAQSDLARKRYGFWASVLATIVGTSIFLSLQQQPDAWIRVLVGVISIAPGVLSAIQVYAKGADKLEQHQAVATQFECLRRGIEARLPVPPSIDEWSSFQVDFRARWQAVTDKAPPCPQKIIDAAEKHMRNRPPFDFAYLKSEPQPHTQVTE